MLRLDVRHLAVLTWAAVNAGLLLAIGNHLDWGRRLRLNAPEPSIQQADSVDVALLGEFTPLALDRHYDQTLKRPLFVPTRRAAPPPPPPPPPPKPTMRKGRFQMVGAMILPEVSYVVLREVSSGKTRRVEKGQSIDGILVQAVEEEYVQLSQYDESEVVTMKVAPSPATPANQPVHPRQALTSPATPAARTPGSERIDRQPVVGGASRANAQKPRSPSSRETSAPGTKGAFEGEDRFKNPLLQGWSPPAEANAADVSGR